MKTPSFLSSSGAGVLLIAGALVLSVGAGCATTHKSVGVGVTRDARVLPVGVSYTTSAMHATPIDALMLGPTARYKIGPSALDIGAVLTALVEMQRPAFTAGGLRLSLDLADTQPFMVYAVEDRLVQVFQNLLSNARSFSPRGGEIAIRAARAAGDIRIDIEDQGPGVAEELREAIFERFHTLRPASEPFGTHSGLGLSISRQITDAHGGTITCTNRQTEDGNVEGARFTVRLPVAADGEK